MTLCLKSTKLVMLFTVVTFLGFGVAAEHPASAQSDRPLTILVSPAKITAAYDVAEYVTVVVRPRSGSILRSADLQTAPVAGLNVRIVKQPSTADFPTANELIWLITIQSTPELCGDVSAVLTVNYTVEQNDDKKGKSFIDVATIPITPASMPNPDQLIQATLVADFTSLLDQSMGGMYIRVKNLTDRPLTITHVAFHQPSFLVVSQPALPTEIPRRGTGLLPFSVSFAGSGGAPVMIGNHIIAAVVTASIPWRGATTEWTVTAENTVTIGVPFVSEINSLIQIPSFLILPGALFVAAYASVLAFSRRAFDTLAQRLAVIELSSSGPGPAVAAATTVSISMSLFVVAMVYPFFTGLWFGQRRDILVGYGFSDVFNIWFLSVGLGFFWGSVTVLGVFLLKAWEQNQGAETRFTVNDSPEDVLGRLAKLGRSIKLPRIQIGEEEIFLLGPAKDATMSWVIPVATARWADPAVARDPSAMTRLDRLIGEGDPKKMSWRIRIALQVYRSP